MSNALFKSYRNDYINRLELRDLVLEASRKAMQKTPEWQPGTSQWFERKVNEARQAEAVLDALELTINAS